MFASVNNLFERIEFQGELLGNLGSSLPQASYFAAYSLSISYINKRIRGRRENFKIIKIEMKIKIKKKKTILTTKIYTTNKKKK
jgi:hypothetical protein